MIPYIFKIFNWHLDVRISASCFEENRLGLSEQILWKYKIRPFLPNKAFGLLGTLSEQVSLPSFKSVSKRRLVPCIMKCSHWFWREAELFSRGVGATSTFWPQWSIKFPIREDSRRKIQQNDNLQKKLWLRPW